jgi:hypothetical protein
MELPLFGESEVDSNDEKQERSRRL